ncbi:hypothetical protein MHU86_7039 [Fragilaria crotonensis]|nr:hypothetical protein MHU86_7039 [Fragilaria crotonensis]
MAGGRGKRKRSRSSEAVTGAQDKGGNEGRDRTWSSSSSGETNQGTDYNRVNASPTTSVLEAMQGGNDEHENYDVSSDDESNACENGGNSPNEADNANSGKGRSDYSTAARGRNARHEHDVNSAVAPSRAALLTSTSDQAQLQNNRHERNNEIRHLQAGVRVTRPADTTVFRENRLLHQQPQVAFMQSQTVGTQNHQSRRETMPNNWLEDEELQQRQVNDGTIRDDGRFESDESRALRNAGKRALSYRVAKELQQRHVKARIQNLVKSHIFRKCKFITSDEHYNKVMKVVVEAENPADPTKFVRIYKTCVVGSLNTKRSSCEQSAAEAVRKLLKKKNHLDEVAPAPYSIETLCKLRQSQTPEEREAFQWFTGELLECVVGKAAWSKKKYQSRISEAEYANTTEKIVTVSDEAFALILYENYIDKWITRYHNPIADGERGKKILGKYTRSSVGYSEYGGWSEEGVIRFNQLCQTVVEDRCSRNAKEAEDQVMQSLRQQRFGEQDQNSAMNGNDRQSIVDSERSLERNVEIVNAFIEL